jgi:hypothetical protein
MILRAHFSGSQSHTVGDEIWHERLADVIRAEADLIASYAGAELLGDATRAALRDRIVSEMKAALVCAHDTYQSPDGVLYTLHDDGEPARADPADTLSGMSSEVGDPVVEEVLRFENRPLAKGGAREANVRWSDGSESTALTWYADEILICEGDLIGKTQGQIRSLHFRRDRDWLQS